LTLIPYFIEYLAYASELPLKGVGVIRLNRTPATLDIAARAIQAPHYYYSFETNAAVEADSLIKWLALRKTVAPDAVVKIYDQLVNEVVQLKPDAMLEWKGVGSWKKNHSAQLVFEPAALHRFQTVTIAAEKVIRSNASHAVQVGEVQSDSIEMAKLLSTKKKKLMPASLFAGVGFVLFLGLLAGFLRWSKLLPASFSNPVKIIPQTSTTQYRTL
jgi:hypothetical protein